MSTWTPIRFATHDTWEAENLQMVGGIQRHVFEHSCHSNLKSFFWVYTCTGKSRILFARRGFLLHIAEHTRHLALIRGYCLTKRANRVLLRRWSTWFQRSFAIVQKKGDICTHKRWIMECSPANWFNSFHVRQRLRSANILVSSMASDFCSGTLSGNLPSRNRNNIALCRIGLFFEGVNVSELELSVSLYWFRAIFAWRVCNGVKNKLIFISYSWISIENMSKWNITLIFHVKNYLLLSSSAFFYTLAQFS